MELKNDENDKPWQGRRTAHDRVVPSRRAGRRPVDARRPAVAEPLDVLADDPEHRRKPTRDERGRGARGMQAHAGSRPANTPARPRTSHATRGCTVSVATKGFDVMVSGEARRVTDATTVAEIAALWAKSGWPAQPDDSGTGITAPFNAPRSDRRRGSSTKSSLTRRRQSVLPKRRPAQCVGGSEARPGQAAVSAPIVGPPADRCSYDSPCAARNVGSS